MKTTWTTHTYEIAKLPIPIGTPYARVKRNEGSDIASVCVTYPETSRGMLPDVVFSRDDLVRLRDMLTQAIEDWR